MTKQVNKTLSQYDQHILITVHNKIYRQVDKFSHLTQHNQICYSVKGDPTKRYINFNEAKRIYIDLYGNPDLRWQESEELKELNLKLRKESRKSRITIGELRKRYVRGLHA